MINNISRTKLMPCPYCRKKEQAKALLRERGSLADNFPDIAKEWHPSKNEPLTPCGVLSRSSKKAWWKCSCGHEWRVAISARAGHGCPECGKKIIGVKSRERAVRAFGSMADSAQELLAEIHPTKNTGVDLSEIPLGSNQKLWWRCSHGYEWERR